MRLTFEVRQDIRRLVAVVGISLAFIVAQTAPALAATDSDRDGLSNRMERNGTETNPFDADSDNDRVEDGDEDEDLEDDGDEDEDDDCDELDEDEDD